MKTTQTNWIRDQLLKHGVVTRNQCLERYISRAAARINDLKRAGFQIEGHSVKTEYGRDFEYRLISKTISV